MRLVENVVYFFPTIQQNGFEYQIWWTRGHFSFLFANSQREILSLSFVRYQSMQTN